MSSCHSYGYHYNCYGIGGGYCASKKWLFNYLTFIIYSDVINCSNWAVRLIDEGRVEICTDGIWMTVDTVYSSWTYNEAKVVCRQLGYYDECNTS